MKENKTNKKTTKTPVVISGYGKERYINGKESGPRTFTCPICGLSEIHSINLLNLHMEGLHGKGLKIHHSEIIEIIKLL